MVSSSLLPSSSNGHRQKRNFLLESSPSSFFRPTPTPSSSKEPRVSSLSQTDGLFLLLLLSFTSPSPPPSSPSSRHPPPPHPNPDARIFRRYLATLQVLHIEVHPQMRAFADVHHLVERLPSSNQMDVRGRVQVRLHASSHR